MYFSEYLRASSLRDIPDTNSPLELQAFLDELPSLSSREKWAILFLAYSQLKPADRQRALLSVVLSLRGKEGAGDAILPAVFRLLRVAGGDTLTLRTSAALIVDFGLDSSLRQRASLPVEDPDLLSGQIYESTFYELMRRLPDPNKHFDVPADVLAAMLPFFFAPDSIRLLTETLLAEGDVHSIGPDLRKMLESAWDLDALTLIYLCSRLKTSLPAENRLDVVGALQRADTPASRRVLAQLWVQQDDANSSSWTSQIGMDAMLGSDFSIGLATEIVGNPNASSWSNILPMIPIESVASLITYSLNLTGRSLGDSQREVSIARDLVFLVGRLHLESPNTARSLAQEIQNVPGWDAAFSKIDGESVAWGKAEFSAGFGLLRK